MSSLADLPDLVGFFSYSRDDDTHSGGALSLLRERIGNELRMQLGRKLPLWQDIEAIPLGSLWEGEIAKAIGESAFFIPVISPSAVNSKFCRMEFEAFLARECELGRSDLVFPILYIPVPELANAGQRGRNEVLKIIHARQYADWTEIRLKDASSPEVKAEVARFCRGVVDALRKAWEPPEERRHKAEVESQERQGEAARRPSRTGDGTSRPATPEASAVTEWRPSPRALVGAGVLAVPLVGLALGWLILPSGQEPARLEIASREALRLQQERQKRQEALRQPLTPERERALKPKDSFKECVDCPEMVVVPAGAFTMGSPESETGRYSDEGPQQVVTISKPFAVGKLHVTVDQFAAFVSETGYEASSKCWTFEGGKLEERANRSWRNPGFAQEGSHPAVCLSWNDARAYVNWLANKTGRPYRMLTEAEWEYAARGWTSPGAYPRFWFGDDEKELCRYGNGADQKAQESIEGARGWTVAPCNDGYAYTSPTGHYQPNAFGLYDMFGNAWQWTADCYHDSYNGAPDDGSAWASGSCRVRVVRGGSWNGNPRFLRSARRDRDIIEDSLTGFRLARTLTR